MSTKTTFKRVALVAVAALGLGVLSVAPSQAANSVLQFAVGDGQTAPVSATLSTGLGVAGAANTVTVQVTSSTTLRTFVTIEGLAGATILSGGTVTTGGQSTLVGTSSSATDVVITTPIAGTITVKAYRETAQTSGLYASTATESVTVTVNAAAQTGSYNAGRSSAYLVGSDTSTADSTTDAAGAFVDGALNGTLNASGPRAIIKVTTKDALAGAVNGVLTVSASGPAFVNAASSYTAARDIADGALASTTVTPSSGVSYVYIYSTGQSGVATITVKTASGTVVTTKTVTFGGSVATTHTLTVKKSIIATSNGIVTATKTGNAYAGYDFKIVLKDSNGNAVRAAQTVAAVSADTSIVSTVTCDTTPDATGAIYCNFGTGAVAGTTSVTVSTGSSSAGTKVSTTVPVTVSSKTPATVTLTATPSAASGAVVTYTLTAKDSGGRAVPDGTSVCAWVYGASCNGGYSVVNGGALADLTNNANTAGTLFYGTTFSGGVATDTVLAPYGDTTLVAAIVMQGTAGVKDAILPANLAGATLTASTIVTNGSTQAANAATDAANEATDAANAATDAALAAADAADAATAAAQDASDAVAALSATVAKLVASLKAQITSLTNLVIKIQKKVKA
jgi:hypothetical protein